MSTPKSGTKRIYINQEQNHDCTQPCPVQKQTNRHFIFCVSTKMCSLVKETRKIVEYACTDMDVCIGAIFKKLPIMYFFILSVTSFIVYLGANAGAMNTAKQNQHLFSVIV